MTSGCHCAACGHDFYTKPIPQDQLDKGHYGPDRTCRRCGRERHYSSEIGVVIRDRTDHFLCPACGNRRERGNSH